MNVLLGPRKINVKSNYVRYISTKCYYNGTVKYHHNADGRNRTQIQLQNKITNWAGGGTIRYLPVRYHNRHCEFTQRYFHLTSYRFDSTPSKIDATVKKLKNQQKEKVEEIMKEVANGQASSATSAAAKALGTATGDADGVAKVGTTHATVTESSEKSIATSKPKKPLRQRIWEELVHYYHGFRLLFIDVAISSKLLWRVLNGKTLTRRENKQLQRTTSDLFRLIPFSVFIVVPFMELLLPLFIKFFPGMLPSTFQTAKDRQDRLRQSLAIRLEVAKFLQKTLDQMPVQHQEHSSEEAKQFEAFFLKIRNPNEYVTNEEIIKFAKRFDDEITLDSLSREQLAALCRVLELNTIGTTTLLRFQLRLKLRSLATDDRVISREGVDSLDLFELQQACKSRGMRAYGLTAERLRFQLKEWIDLSLNEQVPPTLLLLSRAMLISDDSITTDKLKETMRVLPDAVAAHTRHAIGESEGKVDNKTKIEIIQEEERKIREERDEEREESIAQRSALKEDHPLPFISPEELAKTKDTLDHDLERLRSDQVSDSEKGISPTDVQLLSDALKTLSSDKQLVVEKETIKELKEELRDYKEDVEELREVRQVVQEPVRESRAAKLLYNRVNKMISHLDKVLNDLEQRQQHIKKVDANGYETPPRSDLVHIDELVATIRRMKESSDEERFKVVEDLLVKLDADKDGAISVNEITKVVQSIDSEATNIDKKQLEEFTMLLTKQATKRRHEAIVRIDDLMLNIKKLKETSDEARLKHIESVLDKFDLDKDGVVTVNEIRKVLESIGRDNIKLGERAIEELITLLDKEQILQAEQKIEKAIAKSLKEAEKLKSEVEKADKELVKFIDDIHDSAKEIQDIATHLGAVENTDKLKDSKKLEDSAATEIQDKAKCLKVEEDIRDKAKCIKLGDDNKDNTKTLSDCAKDLAPAVKTADPTDETQQSRTTPKSSVENENTGNAETVPRKTNDRQIGKLVPPSEMNLTSTISTPKPKPPASTKLAASAPIATKTNVKKVL